MMRRRLYLLLCLCLCLLTLSSCAHKVTEKDVPVSTYNLEEYTAYYWTGGRTVNESVLPMRGEDGMIAPISLMYPIEAVESVWNAELTKPYIPGRDYKVEDGKLIIPEGSTIPVLNYSDLYLSELLDANGFEATRSGYIFFTEGDFFHKAQLAVTYTHTAPWEGSVPPARGQQLPLTVGKLKNSQPLTIVYYGDSITAGCNSSAVINAQPYAARWTDLVTQKLRILYPEASITAWNEAVGGTDSAWGAQHASTVASRNPDLVVIAFGMNDATQQARTAAYAESIRQIMDTVRAANPACEFILVSSMRSNAEAWQFQGEKLPGYLKALQEMTGEGVALADMTTLHDDLLTRKRFRDMTGNNINHCNDFLARAYAQLILRTLEE